MKHSLKLNIFFNIFLITLLEASQEIYSIKEVAYYINSTKSTLVIFDIDNTLLEPKTDLGSDQWFCYHVQKNMQRGMSSADAIKQILPLYFHINFIIDLVTTESTLVEDIAHIKENCEHMICLTARSFSLAERTLEQLQQNKLYFHIPEFDEFILTLIHPSLYKHGCLFCGLNCKDDVLLAFLDAINYTPDLIIFIDDKEANLSMIEMAAKKRNIDCVCLRYAGCDKRVYNFDSGKTEQELQGFLMQHPMPQ